MRRLFWVALGATAGVLVVRKITKAADSLTPEGAADRVSGGIAGLVETVREFADDVKAGMAVRDAELRQAVGSGEELATPSTIHADRFERH